MREPFSHFLAMVRVRELRGVRAPAKAVLFALVSRSDSEGKSWPSAACLADDTGLGVTAVGVALRELEQGGLLEVERRAGWASVYRLTVGAGPLRQPETPPRETVTHTSPPAGDPSSRDGDPSLSGAPVSSSTRLRETATRSPPAGDGVSASRRRSDPVSNPEKPERESARPPSAQAPETHAPPPSGPRGATPPPEDIPVTPELLARLDMAGARAPTREDVQACLAHARSEGRWYPDWAARLEVWMLKQRGFDASARDKQRALAARPPLARPEPAPAPYHHDAPPDYELEGPRVDPAAALRDAAELFPDAFQPRRSAAGGDR